jgi:RNA polymerase sigma-70 factor, ECF subfamily
MSRPISRPILLPTPNAPSDADLVGRALDGERFGVEVIYRRHAGYLLGMVTRLLANRAEAEGVVEATFVIGLRLLPTLPEPAGLRRWLVRIAVGLTRRRLRRAWWGRWLGRRRNDRRDQDAPLGALAAAELRADDCAALAQIDGILDRVRPEGRVAWMLFRVEGFNLDEVAAACDCSPATAWRRVADIDVLIEDPLACAADPS